MEWIEVTNDSALCEIRELSEKERVLIFKNDCGMVSFMIKKLLDREWNASFMDMKTYSVNTVKNKEISDRISYEFGIDHIVPQVLIISKDKCIHTKVNGYIQYADLKQFANR